MDKHKLMEVMGLLESWSLLELFTQLSDEDFTPLAEVIDHLELGTSAKETQEAARLIVRVADQAYTYAATHLKEDN